MTSARELWKLIGHCDGVKSGEYCSACERRIVDIEKRDNARDAEWQLRVDAAFAMGRKEALEAARREIRASALREAQQQCGHWISATMAASAIGLMADRAERGES